MDIVILIGGAIFVIGLVIGALNTRMRFGLFTESYDSANKGVSIAAILLIIAGLAIMIIKAKLNGQLG